MNKITAQRDVKPVSLLAFHGEFVGLSDVGGVRRIAPASPDHVDKELDELT